MDRSLNAFCISVLSCLQGTEWLFNKYWVEWKILGCIIKENIEIRHLKDSEPDNTASRGMCMCACVYMYAVHVLSYQKLSPTSLRNIPESPFSSLATCANTQAMDALSPLWPLRSGMWPGQYLPGHLPSELSIKRQRFLLRRPISAGPISVSTAENASPACGSPRPARPAVCRRIGGKGMGKGGSGELVLTGSSLPNSN